MDNFALLTHLSNRLLLQNLRTQLERCSEDDALFEGASAAKLLEIVVEVVAAQLSDAVLTAMCKRLARHDEDKVKEVSCLRKAVIKLGSFAQGKKRPA